MHRDCGRMHKDCGRRVYRDCGGRMYRGCKERMYRGCGEDVQELWGGPDWPPLCGGPGLAAPTTPIPHRNQP